MIKCDYCENPAVRNYQRIWVSWVLVNEIWSSQPRIEQERQEIIGPDNVAVCKEHEKEFRNSKLKP